MKECPSCAMSVAEKNKLCPICQYEFAEGSNDGIKIIALLLLIMMLLFFIL